MKLGRIIMCVSHILIYCKYKGNDTKKYDKQKMKGEKL